MVALTFKKLESFGCDTLFQHENEEYADFVTLFYVNLKKEKSKHTVHYLSLVKGVKSRLQLMNLGNYLG